MQIEDSCCALVIQQLGQRCKTVEENLGSQAPKISTKLKNSPACFEKLQAALIRAKRFVEI